MAGKISINGKAMETKTLAAQVPHTVEQHRIMIEAVVSR